MKKYFLMLASTLIAALTLTNCKVDEEDLENNCWKVTGYSTLLVDYEDADLRDDYYYFKEGILYVGYEDSWGDWYVTSTEYSIDDKKIVDKSGISHKIKKGGDLLTIKVETGEKLELSNSKLPAEMEKAIKEGDVHAVSGFDFDYSWTNGWF